MPLIRRSLDGSCLVREELGRPGSNADLNAAGSVLGMNDVVTSGGDTPYTFRVPRSCNRPRVCSEKTTVAVSKKTPETIVPFPTEEAVWRIGRLLTRLRMLRAVPIGRRARDTVATTWISSTEGPWRATNSSAESLCRAVGW